MVALWYETRRAEQLALRISGMRPFDLYLLLGRHMAAKQGRWSLDALTRMVYDVLLTLHVPQAALKDAMLTDRLATDNTGYLPPFLQGDAAQVKAAARSFRETHPEVRHPRIALLSNGSAIVAFWTHKHPVTGRGEVLFFPGTAPSV